MNRFLLLIILPLLCAPVTQGQTIPRRGRFSLLAGYGVSTTLIQPRVTVISGPYELKPEQVNNPECYDDNGHLVSCNGTNRQLSVGVQYRLTNRSQTAGWMLFANVSMQEQTFTLNYPTNRRFAIPVNCTPSIRRNLKSTGASASIGRFWDIQQNGGTQFFARLGVMVARDFRYLRGTNSVSLPDRLPTRYISGGSGTLIEMSNEVPEHNWLITPEIGITGKDFPVELAASVHLPVMQPTVFSELHTFAENNYITGKNRVDYTNAVFNLTLRVGLNLTSATRRAPTSRRSPEPARPATPPTSDPEPVHRPAPDNDRFANRPLNKPITLLINFEQSKANLLPESYTDLNLLVQWMKANPQSEIRLEGHTDLVGEVPENLELSRQRVVAVKDYLLGRGISSYRVETAYFGESRPLNRHCPPPTYCPENRRVEMLIKKR